MKRKKRRRQAAPHLLQEKVEEKVGEEVGQAAPSLPVLRGWVLFMFAAAALCAAAAGAYWFIHKDEMSRPTPPLDIRYEISGFRLRRSPVVSPSEEYPGPNGEIVYLNADQFRAVSAAAVLPTPGYDRKLAVAFAEPDPDVRAQKLAEIVKSVPRSEDADVTALGVYRLAEGAVSAPPDTDARARAKREIDDAIGCRFYAKGASGIRFPKCADRTTMTPVWVLLGASGVPLLAALIGALVNLLRRPRREKARQPGALIEA